MCHKFDCAAGRHLKKCSDCCVLLAGQPGKRTIVRKSKCQLLGVAAGKGAELRKTYHWIPDSPNRAPICCRQPCPAGFKPNNCLHLSPASSSGPRCSSQIHRTIVRIYPTPEPESPGCSCCQHRTNVRITDAAGPKPEHFCQQNRCAWKTEPPKPEHFGGQQHRTELPRTQKNPNNSPIAQVFASARPRKRSYMPDYGFIYYPLLSQPHHLQLG